MRAPKSASSRRRSAQPGPADALSGETAAARYRIVAELTSDWAYELDVEPDGRLARRWVTDAFQRITGYHAAEIDARGGWPALLHPDDVAIGAEQQRRLLQGEANVAEFRILTKDGGVRWLRNHTRPVWDEAHGRIVRIVGAAQDITQLKQTIAELEDWKQRYELAVKVSGQVLYHWDSATDEVTFGGNTAGLFGYPADEMPRRLDAAMAMTHPDDRAAFEREVRRVQRTREPFEMEYRVQCKDGRFVRVADRGFFYADRTGHACMVGMLSDVTDRRRSEQEKAALFEVARDISGTLDFDELLDRVQRRAAEVLGCDSVITFHSDSAQRSFRMISQFGMLPHWLPAVRAMRFKPGSVFGGRLTGGLTVVANEPGEPTGPVAQVFAQFELAALIASPLIVRGRLFGALVGVRRAPGHAFGRHHVELLESIARQLAVGIEVVELYRTQQDEAAVAGALARVGRELISSLDTPVLIDRVCRLTTEVLHCDFSHTFLWQPDAGVYVPMAGYGDTPEQWESMRVLKIPRTMVARLLDRLDDGIAQVTMSRPQDLIPAALPMAYGVTHALYVALRRGAEPIGVLTAGFRGREEPFTVQQERMAMGIAQLASLALENARLVEALERANSLKADFVATMSHELRTPLHVIIGYNDLLLDGMFGQLTESQLDTLTRVRERSRELLELVNATLDLSRLEGGRVPLDLGTVRLAELLAEIEAETRLVREKPCLRFRWQVASNLPPIRTDAVKVKVVIKNLLVNAAKFTDAGEVAITAAARPEGVEITVADTGVGIPPEMQAAIFEPFHQLESAGVRREGGVGLGLYIVRRLLDALGGGISVESQLGHGSTFRVWLPIECAVRPPGFDAPAVAQ
jgi:PAS domain S-box-containing protein